MLSEAQCVLSEGTRVIAVRGLEGTEGDCKRIGVQSPSSLVASRRVPIPVGKSRRREAATMLTTLGCGSAGWRKGTVMTSNMAAV